MRNKITLKLNRKTYSADADAGICIAIPLQSGAENPKAWYVDDPEFSPVRNGDFVGSVRQGAPVNFYNVRFNPHGNGTHTESVGHISPDLYPVYRCVGSGFFLARLASLQPRQSGSDRFISAEQIASLNFQDVEALVIRTLPNSNKKKNRDYSGSNPPFIAPAAMQLIADAGIRHLLIDLPSVDKEEDGGRLSAHKIFWNYPEQPRLNASISEMIFVENNVLDGLYLLQIQIPCFDLDAAPSRPFLYPVLDK